MSERIKAIVTLAAPTSGTVAYDMVLDPEFDTKRIRVGLKYRLLDRLMKSRTRIRTDGRDQRDWASFDMLLDNAQALNARISTLSDVYYLSVACDATLAGADGMRSPDLDVVDPLFVRTSMLMGRYCGTTAAGCVVSDAWHANDGLVNTISARAPFGAPQKPLERDHVEKGIWNVMPDLHVDHGYFQGGFVAKHDPRPFFQDLMELLVTLD